MSELGQPLRLSDWLESRSPRPPAELSARLSEIVGGATCDHEEISAVLLNMAQKFLGTVGDDRSAAIDLLAADALVTYAMEAVAETREDVAAFASEAAARIAAARIA